MEEKQISEDLVLRLKFCWHAISGVRLGFRTGQRRFFAPAGSVQCLPAKEWYLQALPILLHDRTDSCWKSVLRSEWVPKMDLYIDPVGMAIPIMIRMVSNREIALLNLTESIMALIPKASDMKIKHFIFLTRESPAALIAF